MLDNTVSEGRNVDDLDEKLCRNVWCVLSFRSTNKFRGHSKCIESTSAHVVGKGVFIVDGDVCKWSGGFRRLKILVQVPTMLPKWDILSTPRNTGTLVHVFDVLNLFDFVCFFSFDDIGWRPREIRSINIRFFVLS